MEIDTLTAEAEAEWLQKWTEGPKRIRWDRIPLQVGDAAPDLELQDSTGAPRPLSASWHGQPALLLFWRHYGCSCGRERAARLAQEYPSYTELGANVVVIGQGEPARAAAYAELNRLFMQLQPTIPVVYRPFSFYEFSTRVWQGFPDGRHPYTPPQVPGDGLGTEMLWELKLTRPRE